MRGNLWRVSKEQLRLATSHESRSCDMVNRCLANMREDLRQQRGARRYVDVTTEGPPEFGPSEAGAAAPARQGEGAVSESVDVSDCDDAEDEPEREASAAPSDAQVQRLDEEAAGALRVYEAAERAGDQSGLLRALEHGKAAADLAEQAGGAPREAQNGHSRASVRTFHGVWASVFCRFVSRTA